MPEFDFSEFHPLTHAAFGPECWGWAGGPLRHVRIWYLFKFQWPWAEAYHYYRCGRGQHEWVQVMAGSIDGPIDHEECVWCPAQRGYTPPQEVDHAADD